MCSSLWCPIASSLDLRILRGWKTYTLFVHAYNFNQNSVKPFISEQIRVLFTSLSRSGQRRLLLVLSVRWPLHLPCSPNVVREEYDTDRTANGRTAVVWVVRLLCYSSTSSSFYERHFLYNRSTYGPTRNVHKEGEGPRGEATTTPKNATGGVGQG